jgi:hypothetical protein
MMFGVYCGDFTEERTTLLSSVPLDAASGTTMRTLWVLADRQASEPSNYWVLTIGSFGTGSFRAIRTIPFAGGFSGLPQRVSLDPEVPMQRGELMALRVAPTGDSATPLTGLSVIPEYAMTGAKVR